MDEFATLDAERAEAPTVASALGMAYRLWVSADGGTWRFLSVGEGCLALNGVTADAVLAEPSLLYDMILPDHREAFLQAEAEALKTRRPFDIEVPMRRADGQVRWHRIASHPQPQPDGGAIWDGLQIDVTERREMAQTLEAQRRRLEVAVETTKLGLWEWDLRSNQIVWSIRNRELFGLSHDVDVTLERYLALVHPDDVDALRDAYVAAREAPGGGDFSLEHRLVAPDGDVRWVLVNGRVVVDEDGPAMVLGTSLDITRRRVAEERRSLLMGELAHRAKNGIAIMLAMVHQTARSATSVQGFEASLAERLQAMADAQDLVTATGGRPVLLSDIIARTLSPFELERFDVASDLTGAAVAGDLAVGLALLLHEMATNAVKYGALSNAAGRVTITGGAAGPARFALDWREAGGPPVTPSGRQGFGTRLLQAVLRPQGGKVEFSFEPAGFVARLEFPHHG